MKMKFVCIPNFDTIWFPNFKNE